MPDTIGRIEVPDITPSGTFPVRPLPGSGRALAPEVAIHTFRSGSTRIEQRFLLGTEAQRFRVVAGALGRPEITALRNFWNSNQGAYGSFTYNAPNEANLAGGTTPHIVRFAQRDLTFEYLTDFLASVGVELIEVPQGNGPSFDVEKTVLRVPDAPLSEALLEQDQILIPLLKIRVDEEAVPTVYISDRRVTIGGHLHQARLLKWEGISQSITGEPDRAVFTLGNADGVMTAFLSDTDCWAAEIEFSLFHRNSLTKIDLWRGHWQEARYRAESFEFHLTAGDGLFALTLPYPPRRITRTCGKLHKGPACPNGTVGTNAETPCGKSFDGPAGCVFHGMQEYFGGILTKPQPVRTADNSTGVWGFGRSPLMSTSIISPSLYEQVLPEHYVNNWTYPLPVRAKLISGRDEGDFYDALGILGAGPVGAFAPGHKLDGSLNHGPGNYGLRTSLGHDPNPDPFSLGEGGHGQAQAYGPERAAGVAFIELRRSDEKGLQLTKLSDHDLEGFLAQGLGGWTWTAPGARAWADALTNPVWIQCNAILRALGLHHADVSAATQEEVIDVEAAIDLAANVCDVSVPSLVARRPIETSAPTLPGPDPNDTAGYDAIVPAGTPSTITEKQFQFTGSIQEEKPLRDWLREIGNSYLGFWTFRGGRFRPGSRFHSGSTDTYTDGNIIIGSLEVALHKPAFNRLVLVYADEEFGYVSNSVEFYDVDHAVRMGRGGQPLFTRQEMNLVGVSDKSQALRLLICRLREELGGANAGEQKKARRYTWKTTVLGLASECGNVASLTHPDVPAGAECRIERWRLSPDYSITLEAKTTTDSMYEYTTGPKPADAAIPELPVDPEPKPQDWGFAVDTTGDGYLRFSRLYCNLFQRTVAEARFDVYHVDESAAAVCSLVGGCDNGQTVFNYVGQAPEPGEWIQVRSELMQVLGVSETEIVVSRGALGTSAVAHARSASAISNPAEHRAAFDVEGTGWYPGELATLDPSAEYHPICGFESGRLTVTLPYPDLTGQSVYADPRIWRVRKTTVVISLPPRFFVSPARAQFEYPFSLPHARVLLIEGKLRNQAGLESETIRRAARLRTDGGNALEFVHPELLAGYFTNAFDPVRVPIAQSFRGATMRVTLPGAGPLPAPRAVPSLRRASVSATGTLAIGGEVSLGSTVVVNHRDARLVERAAVDGHR